ncbi:hypothetical protein EDB86DRAFT_2838286 [Lactarius hatsudake]|nr:hypothetical protein EDB86DRAFT_2838286 [Lactarius hatsudake]
MARSGSFVSPLTMVEWTTARDILFWKRILTRGCHADSRRLVPYGSALCHSNARLRSPDISGPPTNVRTYIPPLIDLHYLRVLVMGPATILSTHTQEGDRARPSNQRERLKEQTERRRSRARSSSFVGNWRGRGPELERLESELEFQLQMGVPSSKDAEQVSKDAPMLNELTEPHLAQSGYPSFLFLFRNHGSDRARMARDRTSSHSPTVPEQSDEDDNRGRELTQFVVIPKRKLIDLGRTMSR